MANNYLTAAWEQDLRPTLKLVLIMLADHADPGDGTCWPSIERLAHYTGLDRRTVQRSLREMEQDGLLSSQPRFDDKRTREYTILFPPASGQKGGTPPPPAPGGTEDPGVDPDEGGARSRGGGGGSTGGGTRSEKGGTPPPDPSDPPSDPSGDPPERVSVDRTPPGSPPLALVDTSGDGGDEEDPDDELTVRVVEQHDEQAVEAERMLARSLGVLTPPDGWGARWLERVTIEQIRSAVDEARAKGARSYRYVDAILEGAAERNETALARAAERAEEEVLPWV